MSNCYYGDFLTGKTIRCRFNTNSTLTAAPASLAGGAVTVSKDGVDVTPSGGVTLNADFGTVVGRNVVVIDLSVDTTTFTAGSEYSVRLSAGTVGGLSVVGLVVGEWSIMNRSTAVDATGRVTVGSNTDKGGYSLATAPPTAAQIAAAVLTDTTDTLGADVLAIKAQTDKLAFTGSSVNANTAAVGGFTATATAPVSFDNLDARVSTRSTYAGGAVASVAAPVTVGTNNDKTGYVLATPPPTVSQIDAQLSGTHGPGAWGGSGGGGGGAATLAANGLDAVMVETGVNLRQAVADILAVCVGVTTGLGTGSVGFAAAGNPAVNRVTAALDFNGNRSSVTLNSPP